MQLVKLEFENYKAFKEKQLLDLKPITILIGKNSSGKSALTSLLLWLKAHMLVEPLPTEAPQTLPPQLECPPLSLLYQCNPKALLSLKLTFQQAEDTLTLSLTLSYTDAQRMEVVSLGIWENQAPVLTLEKQGDPYLSSDDYAAKHLYEGVFSVVFNGFLPETLKVEEGGIEQSLQLYSLTQKIRNAFRFIRYMSPVRAFPQRQYTYQPNDTFDLGMRGEKMPHVLRYAQLEGLPLLGKLRDWCARHYKGWQLEVEANGEHFQLVMRHPKHKEVRMNWVEMGSGFAQMLPVVVQGLISYTLHSLEILEQPELGLHPVIQPEIAQLFAQIAKDTHRNFIIETHSETFILRIRRLIAEGKLDSKDVGIYGLDDEGDTGSRLKAIHLREDGNVKNWPKGIFSEHFKEVMAMRRAQRQRKDQA